MTAIIAGFICALVIAAVVLIVITYCMFFKEKHKSELTQYEIGDLRQRNQVLSNIYSEDEPKKKRNLAAAIFVLPGRPGKHKSDDSYTRRPDYPENSPISAKPVNAGAEEVIEAMSHNNPNEMESHGNDYCFQIDSGSQYHSEV